MRQAGLFGLSEHLRRLSAFGDTAYRSQANEAWFRRQSRVSRIHRRKPRGRPMPEPTARANAAKSKVRALVEHVFAWQKDQMGLIIRTICIKRAEAKITLAILACTMHRLIFHERSAAMGWLRPDNGKFTEKRTNEALKGLQSPHIQRSPSPKIRSDHRVDGGTDIYFPGARQSG